MITKLLLMLFFINTESSPILKVGSCYSKEAGFFIKIKGIKSDEYLYDHYSRSSHMFEHWEYMKNQTGPLDGVERAYPNKIKCPLENI